MSVAVDVAYRDAGNGDAAAAAWFWRNADLTWSAVDDVTGATLRHGALPKRDSVVYVDGAGRFDAGTNPLLPVDTDAPCIDVVVFEVVDT